MRKLFLLLFAVALTASCSRGDLSITQEPTSTDLKQELQKRFEDLGVETPNEEVDMSSAIPEGLPADCTDPSGFNEVYYINVWQAWFCNTSTNSCELIDVSLANYYCTLWESMDSVSNLNVDDVLTEEQVNTVLLQLTRSEESTICSDPNSQQFVFYTDVDGDLTYYWWNGSDLVVKDEAFYNDKCNQWKRRPLSGAHEEIINLATRAGNEVCTNPSNPNHSVIIIWEGSFCSAREVINGVSSDISCFGDGGAIDKCNQWKRRPFTISNEVELTKEQLQQVIAVGNSRTSGPGDSHYCGDGNGLHVHYYQGQWQLWNGNTFVMFLTSSAEAGRYCEE